MENKEYTLHLISHTHWDREWYQTFQQFRLRLVHLIDHVLTLIGSDPEFKFFMLDGQTIVLEDYLDIRSEKGPELKALIQSGKILIGPWYILPDEFLVSPEATIRNLLLGDRICKEFDRKMLVGYIPDPFGHIGQMPQILHGFEIENACLWRGLSDEPCEFWWSAPDGSKVFMAYLRDGYGNGSGLNTSRQDIFREDICRARDSLAPYSAASHLLIMHGTDHMEPQDDISAAIASFNSVPVNPHTCVLHSTLPEYLAAVQAEIQAKGIHLPIVTGELRSCKRAPLLPGVLSARMWIKQRNHACQTVLEKWAEPFSAWANEIVEEKRLANGQFPIPTQRIEHPQQAILAAWRLLIQCHPHDSICGCSIDQVHEEMRVRFDQAEQIGQEITRQSLLTLAEAIQTTPKPGWDTIGAITVFNPTSGPRTDWVEAEYQLPEGIMDFEILDENSRSMPHYSLTNNSKPFVNMTINPEEFKALIGVTADGRVGNLVITRFKVNKQASSVLVQITFSETGAPDLHTVHSGLRQLKKLLDDPTVSQYNIRGVLAATTRIVFLAQDVPGFGYRTFWIRATQANIGKSRISDTKKLPPIIENEFFCVEISQKDGTLTVLDKRSKLLFKGLNCFVDGGDCGDEYNYSPPENDQVIRGARLIKVRLRKNPVQQTLHLDLELNIPQKLSKDRQTRSKKRAVLKIHSSISLLPGIPRIDIHTEVNNTAQDHRLRVHFPAPFAVQFADCDGHFEIVRRPVSTSQDGNLPYPDPTWSEQPRTEMPQLAFTDISDGKNSLLIANRGLPEVAVLPNSEGGHEIALTLLRCVGWLSREDLSTRKGHAGPDLPTPGAQMLGKYGFDYAILPHSADEAITAYHQAYAFNAPLRSAVTSLHNGPLPATGAMIEVTPPEFVISSIKTSEDGSGWIVRGYNISSQPIQVSLRPWQPFDRASRVNLLEKPQEALSLGQQGEISFRVSAFQVASIKFT